jgi:hypothetical protein
MLEPTNDLNSSLPGIPDGERFYFRIWSDGVLTKDTHSGEFADRRAACIHAHHRVADLLRDAAHGQNRWVSIEVCDAKEQTVAIVRGALRQETL